MSLETFCSGDITRSVDFFVKIFSAHTEEVLRINLALFTDQFKRLGKGEAQLKAISLLLKGV